MFRLALQRATPAPLTRSMASLPAEIKSYTRALFFGHVNAKQAFPYPDVMDQEAKETVRSLIEPISRFFDEKVDSKKIDRDAKIPEEVLTGLKELGVFGLQVSCSFCLVFILPGS